MLVSRIGCLPTWIVRGDFLKKILNVISENGKVYPPLLSRWHRSWFESILWRWLLERGTSMLCPRDRNSLASCPRCNFRQCMHSYLVWSRDLALFCLHRHTGMKQLRKNQFKKKPFRRTVFDWGKIFSIE